MDLKNYWVDRIELKNKLQNELDPLLKQFIGMIFASTTKSWVVSEVENYLNQAGIDYDVEIRIIKRVQTLQDGSTATIIHQIVVSPADP